MAKNSTTRVTIRVPERIIDDIDDLVNRGIYHNRSAAIRAAMRGLDGVAEPRRSSPTSTPTRAPKERKHAVADGGLEQSDDHPPQRDHDETEQ